MSPIAISAPFPISAISKAVITENRTLDGVHTDSVFHQSTDKLSKNPLHRTWRGDKEGTLKIEAYPEFHNATDEEGLLKKRQWIKEHLAIAFRFWGKMGYGEGIRLVSLRFRNFSITDDTYSGHITVRVSCMLNFV